MTGNRIEYVPTVIREGILRQILRVTGASIT